MSKTRIPLFVWVTMLQLSLTACGGGGGPPPPPPPDFSVAVSPTSLSAVEGSSSGSATISVSPANGFTGSVMVAISGLPTGATTNPSSPLPVSAGSPQQFTVTTTDATPTGTVSLTLHATSGSLAHDATVSLTTNPVIQTSQSGTMLYLQSHANGHTARIGLETAWGGAIAEVSLDGTNFVNRHDTGREVQPAVYDGSLSMWNPTLAGDEYDHASPLLDHELTANSLYTRTTPLQWYPDAFGGGPNTPIPSDMTFEQTVTLAPGVPLAFQVHFKLTHNGVDTHYHAPQELPAVYVNSSYQTFSYYGGTAPWTNGAIAQSQAPASSQDFYTPERWAALVDSSNNGLTVYVPSEYPYWSPTFFPQSGGSGPTGDATTYMHPSEPLSILPGASFEYDAYLIPGELNQARAAVYTLHQTVPISDIFPPFASIDIPVPGATISGTNVDIAGWAFDDVAVSTVSVYIDGALKGVATLGSARPDVAAAYPHVAPVNCGWTYSLDSTTISNGAHAIGIRISDTSSNESLLTLVPVTVNN